MAVVRPDMCGSGLRETREAMNVHAPDMQTTLFGVLARSESRDEDEVQIVCERVKLVVVVLG